MLDLNEIKQDHEIAAQPAWWSDPDRRRATARLLEQIPALVAELREARIKINAQAAELRNIRPEVERLRVLMPSPDCSEKEVAIVMCYTGWDKERSEDAIEQWRQTEPAWSAEYMKGALSARQLKMLEELTNGTVDL